MKGTPMGDAQTLEAPETEPFVCPPDHPHGKSQACRHHGCRCTPCRVAHNARQRNMRKQIAYGRRSTVDAQPARDHIAALRARGMGVKVISRLSGLAFPTVGGIMWGREGRPAPKRIQRRTADAILAVQFDLDELLPAAMVDVTPTRRRLQALACLGWTWTALADEAGMRQTQVSAIVSPKARGKVQADTARRIRDMYERLWNVTPTPVSALQASKHVLAKRRAASEGWVPPLGWDDIDNDPEPPKTAPADDDVEYIDDVKVERALRGENRHGLNYAEKRAAVTIAHARHWSDALTAHRIDVASETVRRIRNELGLEVWPMEEQITMTEGIAA